MIRNSSRQTNTASLLVLVGICIWTLSQSLNVLEILPDTIRGPLFIWKNVFAALLMSIIAFIVYSRMTVRTVKGAIKINWFIALTSLLFPIYITLHSIAIPTTQVEEIALYWLWALSAYIIVPIYFQQNEAHFWQGASVQLWSNVLIISVGVIIGITGGNIYWNNWSNRATFGFLSPIPFGYSLQATCFSALLFGVLNHSKGRKFFYLLLSITAFSLIILAQSRNALLFVIGVAITAFILTPKIHNLLKIATACLAISTILIVTQLNLDVTYPNFASINQLSSGRLLLWQDTYTYNLSGQQLYSQLFGIGQYTMIGTLELDQISAEYRYSRVHIDNAYLDIVLQYGYLGLILFLLPFFSMIRSAYSAFIFADSHNKSVPILILGFWTGIFLQMITISVVPSFGNSVNVLFILMITPLSLNLYRTTTRVTVEKLKTVSDSCERLNLPAKRSTFRTLGSSAP